MAISQVPSVMQFHEEYFAYKVATPIVQGISRYTIPNRAIGMRLRDLMWSDESGNFFDMARISPDDKSYFQRNIGSHQSIHKFYMEGNDVVLTPGVQSSGSGNLNFFIYLRPNQLVDDTRAATIKHFHKEITITNSALQVGDSITITTGNNSVAPSANVFELTNRLIASSSTGNPGTITTVLPHGIPNGDTFTVVITEHTGSVPALNNRYTATSTGANTFTIPVNITTAGTGGKFAVQGEFSLGSTAIQTAANLADAINHAIKANSANNNSSNIITLEYDDVSTSFNVASNGISVDTQHIYMDFDQLPTTWTDPITNVTETLYKVGGLVDILQTNPGHKTYTYDVELKGISGTVGKFDIESLKYYPSNATGGEKKILPIVVGDYICVQHECIIPQIPPDLHNGLAERTSARILAAIGDQQGVDRVNQKIAEIEQRQGTLLDQRVDGAPQKITARFSPLRSFKSGSRRRS
jgi:hypothetical protein